ncbi:conserved hypothetical protein [Methanococcus vannielii SB]|uniref:Uncharacterized protein n=1 Tax=Methanococcus vannielii (strain ATCC 35089 / DSM 1224 / JCM 13029 / OCM 148 / SB) TaxID=406327 RepID=A6UPJ6_METVS|nr:hypothetical protein [Methanococcus vannielii]ABR54418.1 conserved hypothetical protein [Methanococcus vannielii SB]
MKKISLILSIILLSSFCLCTEKNSNDLFEYSDSTVFMVTVGENKVPIELRAKINDSFTTLFKNTDKNEIKSTYYSENHEIIYIEYDRSLPAAEGGVSVADLKLKLIWANSYFNPHVIIVPGDLTENGTYADIFYKDGSIESTFLNNEHVDKVKNSNKTIVIDFQRTENPATIEKYNNTYIIEGNSLIELDKAESMFIIALLS